VFVVVGGFISTSLSVGSLVVDLELKLVFGTCAPKSLYSGSNDYIFEYLAVFSYPIRVTPNLYSATM
jgi:hypothetical protein